MKALFCPLATPGFVYPAIAVARSLQRRGHQAAFVTGPAYQETLAQAELVRIPRGRTDGSSFAVERWFHPLDIAMQAKHIEYALDRFAPDVIVGHPLSLGTLIVRARARVPTAVLGMAVQLWPVPGASAETDHETARRLAWRQVVTMGYLNDARKLFQLGPCDDDPLLGDLFMLQSVPELGIDVDHSPPHVHLVGACLWEPPATQDQLAWLDAARAAGEPLIYVHHGRSFDRPSFLPLVVDALGGRRVRVAAAVGRMDHAVGDPPPNFLVRPHLCQGRILPHARLVISGGNTTAVLGALCHGVPALLLPGDGAEQLDTAELVARAGSGRLLPVDQATAPGLARAVDELLAPGDHAHRAQDLARAFARWDGPDRAAQLVERLAGSRSHVPREPEGAGCH